jgi:ELWxxDGT repeat protein
VAVDIGPGSSISSPFLTLFNGHLYFFARHPTAGHELFRSDGTPAGTELLKNIAPGSTGVSPRSLSAVNGLLYFTFTVGDSAQLWRSDGTEAGTMLLTSIAQPGGIATPVFPAGGGGVFAVSGAGSNTLWVTDGSVAGTMPLNLAPPLATPLTSNPGFPDAAPIGSELLFPATQSGDREIWKTNGTLAGTVRLKDIRAGSSSIPRNLLSAAGTVYFTANDGVSGIELWKSDGTPAGTSLVRDIHPIGNASPVLLGSVGSRLYFAADDGIHGRELWTTDGSANGTVLVRDVAAGSNSMIFASSLPLSAGGKVFFAADDGQHGQELWIAGDYTPVSYVTPQIGSVTPDPRTTPAGVVQIQFSEAVTGVEISDFSLTRGGVSVSLTGLTVAGSGAAYTLDLSTVSAPLGNYVLTLNPAGISDLGGLPLAVGAQESFQVVARPWHNAAGPLNVDDKDGIVALDALIVINEINNRMVSHAVTGLLLSPTQTPQAPYYLDASNDGFVTPLDALLIFNWLNTHPAGLEAEGEGERRAVATGGDAEGPDTFWEAALLSYLADEHASHTRRRR